MKGKPMVSLTALLLASITLMLMANPARGQSEDKRAPSGFMGMRGKKDEGGTEGDGEVDKRAPSGLMGMRGKKEGLQEGFSPFASNQDILLGGDKRASPNSGFFAMRGKKAPSGFLGIRGKKLSDTSDEESDNEDVNEGDYNAMWQPGSDQGDSEGLDGYMMEESKRAPSGFMGMRGKKKTAGYYRYRGKKAPSGFLGMRGKKAPSGFLGMRGKKNEDDENEDGHSFEDIDSLLNFLINANAEDYHRRMMNTGMNVPQKKAPSGFLGMRGKRWASWIEQGSSSSVTTNPKNLDPLRKSNSPSISSSHL